MEKRVVAYESPALGMYKIETRQVIALSQLRTEEGSWETDDSE